MFDRLLNLFHGHAIGLLHLATVLVNDVEQILRHRRRAVHDQMRIGNAGVDFFHAADGQHIARGWAREFIRAVAGANRYRQRVELRGLHKLRGFFGVGQHLAVVELANSTYAVFFASLTCFQAA